MAADDDRSARRSADPLVAGVGDGVAAGYEALEHVLEGLRESLRHRGRADAGHASAAPVRAAHRRRGRDEPAGSDVLEDLAEVAAELLDRGADVAQEVAAALGRRGRDRSSDPGVLSVQAVAGAEATVEFHVTNTSSVALRDVEFFATELMLGRERIGLDAVGFKPGGVERLSPGRSTAALVSVSVPSTSEPGTYRGLVGAEPGGAWAVLELDVEAAEADAGEHAADAPELADESPPA